MQDDLVNMQFQSTLPHRSDSPSDFVLCYLGISIHTPSRERPVAHHRRQQKHNFNPRSLTGATLAAYKLLLKSTFPSTLPYGSAPGFQREVILSDDFNPRSLAGATSLMCLSKRFGIFQSTLPRGSDRGTYWDGVVIDISIHAPSRERQQEAEQMRLSYEFQSTLPHGSDTDEMAATLGVSNFNPRSLTGATWC